MYHDGYLSSIMAVVDLAQKRKKYGRPIGEFVVGPELKEWELWDGIREGGAVVTFLKPIVRQVMGSDAGLRWTFVEDLYDS